MRVLMEYGTQRYAWEEGKAKAPKQAATTAAAARQMHGLGVTREEGCGEAYLSSALMTRAHLRTWVVSEARMMLSYVCDLFEVSSSWMTFVCVMVLVLDGVKMVKGRVPLGVVRHFSWSEKQRHHHHQLHHLHQCVLSRCKHTRDRNQRDLPICTVHRLPSSSSGGRQSLARLECGDQSVCRSPGNHYRSHLGLPGH